MCCDMERGITSKKFSMINSEDILIKGFSTFDMLTTVPIVSDSLFKSLLNQENMFSKGDDGMLEWWLKPLNVVKEPYS